MLATLWPDVGRQKRRIRSASGGRLGETDRLGAHASLFIGWRTVHSATSIAFEAMAVTGGRR